MTFLYQQSSYCMASCREAAEAELQALHVRASLRDTTAPSTDANAAGEVCPCTPDLAARFACS